MRIFIRISHSRDLNGLFDSRIVKNRTYYAQYFLRFRRGTIDYLLGRTDEHRKFIPQNPQPFKERFPILLEKFNTNKYRVAKSTALHQSVLYRWQSGDCSPELDSLIILADYFDCSVEYIIGRCETVW